MEPGPYGPGKLGLAEVTERDLFRGYGGPTRLRNGGDEAILREFYPTVKKSTICTMTMCSGPDGIVSLPEGNVGREWWEAEDGTGSFLTLGACTFEFEDCRAMAEKMGDTAFAQQCRDWYEQGMKSLDKTWAGEYYVHYYEPETGKRSDTIMPTRSTGTGPTPSTGCRTSSRKTG